MMSTEKGNGSLVEKLPYQTHSIKYLWQLTVDNEKDMAYFNKNLKAMLMRGLRESNNV